MSLLLVAVACAAPDDASPPPSAAAVDSSPDSATSMPALLRRFQSETRERPTALANAAPSREALVQRFVAAVEQGDTSAVLALRVTRAEFAYLFFPVSTFMRPPYELDPAVVWLQIDAESEKGASRLLRTLGGRPLGTVVPVCGAEPQRHGDVALWGCDVRRVRAAGDTVVDRLFGAILERDGAFKFLSLGNRL